MEQEIKPSFAYKIKSFYHQCERVWHIMRKPSQEEFLTIAKVSAVGILIIGAFGFVISLMIKALL